MNRNICPGSRVAPPKKYKMLATYVILNFLVASFFLKVTSELNFTYTLQNIIVTKHQYKTYK